MSITFTVNFEESYYISKFIGIITDQELVDAYQCFFQSDQFIPGLNELADLSQIKANNITREGLEKLSNIIAETWVKHSINPKSSVYAPDDLAYGLAMMYSAGAERFEKNNVFRTMDEAKEWLKESYRDH